MAIKEIAGTTNVQVCADVKKMADLSMWMETSLGERHTRAASLVKAAMEILHSVLYAQGLLHYRVKTEEEAYETLRRTGIILKPKYNDMRRQERTEIENTPGMADFIKAVEEARKLEEQAKHQLEEPTKIDFRRPPPSPVPLCVPNLDHLPDEHASAPAFAEPQLPDEMTLEQYNELSQKASAVPMQGMSAEEMRKMLTPAEEEET